MKLQQFIDTCPATAALWPTKNAMTVGMHRLFGGEDGRGNRDYTMEELKLAAAYRLIGNAGIHLFKGEKWKAREAALFDPAWYAHRLVVNLPGASVVVLVPEDIWAEVQA